MDRNPSNLPIDDAPMSEEWNWHPNLPIPNSPLFEWPMRPSAIFRWLAKSWFELSMTTVTLGTAILTANYLQPTLEGCATFEFGWIAQIYLRNFALITIIAGGLHLYLHTYKLQGKKRKFIAQEFAKNKRMFTLSNQVWDNMFWSLASGVTTWTAYEVLYFWALSNGYIPQLNFSQNPILGLALFLLTPFWLSFHFYWAHRFLHWGPLYQPVHSLHHRNITTGPWSGFSMHPIEHVLYLSSCLIHVVVPSNPILMLFHMHLQVLNPLASHSGFEELLAHDKEQMALGSFYHQLHHRFFECNYGSENVPWDKWFGSFHDGRAESTEQMRKRLSGK